MANINHLEMGEKLLALPEITVKKSLFGLKTTLTYTPTQSKVRIIQNEYSAAMGEKLESILKADTATAIRQLASSKFEKMSVGNMRMDACVSDDNQFAAIQLLRFVDFDYKPTTAMQVYEGKEAEAFAAFCKQ